MTLFNEDYEATVIGLLLSYDHLHEQIIPRLTKFAFYEAKSRVIFDAIKTLFDAGDPVNVATVSRLAKNIAPDVLPADISKYLLDVKYTEDASHYTNHLLDMQVRRDVITTAQDPTTDVNTIIDIVNGVTPDDDFGVSGTATAIHDYLDQLETRAKNGNALVGIPYKWQHLNTITSGIERGQLIYIGGRPGMGKSALLQNQALQSGLSGYKTLFISCEISEFSVVNNLVGIHSGIPPKTLKTANLTHEQWKKVHHSAGMIDKPNQFIFKTRGKVTPLTVENLIKRYKPDIVFIDYLQLMATQNGIYKNDRTNQVAFISNSLKQIALQYNIPIVIAVQLNRQLESRQDKRPLLSDLKQSGDIEQDADIVLFIYREDYYNAPKDIEIEYSKTEIILAKNREGANNYAIDAMMHMPTLRIQDIERRNIAAD